jgi:hypothetical protein
MKNTLTFLAMALVGLFSACDAPNEEPKDEVSSEEVDTTIVVDVEEELIVKEESDELKQLLKLKQDQFIQLLLNDQFEECQEMLCEEGVYFYTSNRIPKAEFTEEGLTALSMPLRGAYEYGLDDQPDSLVNGFYWRDSLANFRNDEVYSMHQVYQVQGFGFTGNYYEELLDKETGWPIDFEPNDTLRIVNTSHDRYINEGMDWEILMVEFRLRNDEWKIYAIGNLEWTP